MTHFLTIKVHSVLDAFINCLQRASIAGLVVIGLCMVSRTAIAQDVLPSGAKTPQDGSGAFSAPGSGSVGPRGTFGYSVGVMAPPGRAGMAGGTGLSYAGGRSSDMNIAGYGWSVPMAAITRTTRNGVNHIYDNMEFFAPGDGELIETGTNGVYEYQLGNSNTTNVQADYDNDSRTDYAVFNPSSRVWYIRNSSTAVIWTQQSGSANSVPVPADYNGDGKADIATYLSGTWSILYTAGGGSSSNVSLSGTPVPADYDGDGTDDVAVVNSISNQLRWTIRQSSGSIVTQLFGSSSSTPVPADYDGDHKADLAVFQTNWAWSVRQSITGLTNAFLSGWTGGVPVSADYDGDQKADYSAYWPTNSRWSISFSAGGQLVNFEIPGSGDNSYPAVGDYDGDGAADLVVYGPDDDTLWSFVRQPPEGQREFRPRYESSFTKYFFDATNNVWWCFDQAGTKYTYGGTSDARLADPSRPYRVFSWYLTETRDSHDNYVKYTYVKDMNQVYPKQILYTGFGTDDGKSSIIFLPFYTNAAPTNRSDITVSYATGFAITNRTRLELIASFADEDISTLSGYSRLDYTSGVTGIRSVLKSVTRYGNSGISGLPPVSFEYRPVSTSLIELTSYRIPTGYCTVGRLGSPATAKAPRDGGIRFADINGDGLPDMLYANGYPAAYESGATPGKKIWINTGTGWLADTNWVLPTLFTNQSQFNDDQVNFQNRLNKSITPDPTGLEILDLNGDGLADLTLAQSYIGGGSWHDIRATWINNGHGWTRDDRWNLPAGLAFVASTSIEGVDDVAISMNVSMPDLNGDGLPDLVYAVQYSAFRKLSDNHVLKGKYVYLNTGHGWEANNSWKLPDPYYLYGGMENDGSDLPADGAVRFADINSDGLPDLLYYNGSNHDYDSGAQANKQKVWLNTGGGWATNASWVLPCPFVENLREPVGPYKGTDDSGVRIVDINGDGLVDFLRCRLYYDDYHNKYVTNSTAWLNTGVGWTSNSTYAPPLDCAFVGTYDPSGSSALTTDTGVQVLDLNGDGAPEYVYSRHMTYGYPSVDTRFSEDRIPSINAVKTYQGKLGYELMTKVKNGIGGSQEVFYVSSSLTSNYQGRSSYDIVATNKTYDGMGATYTSRYDYSGGWFFFDTNNCHRNEYRGFHRVADIDSTGASNVTYYHQGGGVDGSALGESQDTEAKAGHAYRTEVYGSDGLLYASSITKWDCVTNLDAAASTQTRLWAKAVQTVSLAFEGLANHRATASQVFYDDQTGLPTNTISLGEVFANAATGTITDIVSGDELYSFTEYASFTNAYIKGRPSRTAVYADSAKTIKLSETLLGYKSDGLPEYTANWLNTLNTYVTNGAVKTYDVYGNPTLARDAIGVQMSTTYDSTHHMYPVTVNLGGMISTKTFDQRSGLILSSTDPLGVTVSNTYDKFYRPLKAYRDGLWLQEVTYTLGGIAGGSPSNIVFTKLNIGSSGNGQNESYAYLDGLGRTRQARAESERGDFRVANSVFDQHGRVTQEFEPYFSAGGSYASYSPTNPVVTYAYDPLGRVTNVTPRTGDTDSPTAPVYTRFKDGTNPWARVSVDASGFTNKVFLDAYGRTLSVLNYHNSQPMETQYRYDLLGRMTEARWTRAPTS